MQTAIFPEKMLFWKRGELNSFKACKKSNSKITFSQPLLTPTPLLAQYVHVHLNYKCHQRLSIQGKSIKLMISCFRENDVQIRFYARAVIPALK